MIALTLIAATGALSVSMTTRTTAQAAFEDGRANAGWQPVVPFRNQTVTSFTAAKGTFLNN